VLQFSSLFTSSSRGGRQRGLQPGSLEFRTLQHLGLRLQSHLQLLSFDSLFRRYLFEPFNLRLHFRPPRVLASGLLLMSIFLIRKTLREVRHDFPPGGFGVARDPVIQRAAQRIVAAGGQ
jgi:hypothetical protein